jgi:hypothetical protein
MRGARIVYTSLSRQTAFKGKVYMTHATKAIYKLLLLDFVRVSKVAVEDMLYDEHDLERSMAKIEVGPPPAAFLPCLLARCNPKTPERCRRGAQLFLLFLPCLFS